MMIKTSSRDHPFSNCLGLLVSTLAPGASAGVRPERFDFAIAPLSAAVLLDQRFALTRKIINLVENLYQPGLRGFSCALLDNSFRFEYKPHPSDNFHAI
jgi:hypothetical protein